MLPTGICDDINTIEFSFRYGNNFLISSSTNVTFALSLSSTGVSKVTHIKSASAINAALSVNVRFVSAYFCKSNSRPGSNTGGLPARKPFIHSVLLSYAITLKSALAKQAAVTEPKCHKPITAIFIINPC